MIESVEMRFRRRGFEGAIADNFAPSEITKQDPTSIAHIVRFRSDSTGDRLRSIAYLEPLLWGWRIDRKYTKDEIRKAQLFRLDWKHAPMQDGDLSCYDISGMCDFCGAGRKQISDLVLDLKRLPRRNNFVKTFSDEVVISRDAAAILMSYDLTGFLLRPVQHSRSRYNSRLNLPAVPSGRRLIRAAEDLGFEYQSVGFDEWLNRKGHPLRRSEHDALFKLAIAEGLSQMEKSDHTNKMPAWFQVVPVGAKSRLTLNTRFGYSPLDDDKRGQYRCPLGHTEGWALLSEAYVDRGSWVGFDYSVSEQLYGQHPTGSVFYARPVVIISPRMRQALESAGIRGWIAELAHFE